MPKLTMMQALEKVALACAYANPQALEGLVSLRESPEDISHGVDLIKEKYAECYDFERN